MAAGGVTVVATEDGEVVAYEPSGEQRWRAQPFDDPPVAGAWAHGHLVSVYDQDTGVASLHRLLDGEPLGFHGHPVTATERYTLVQLESSPGGLVLLDEGGELWRTDAFDGSDCVVGARFASTTVELTTCADGEVTLDRGDGSVLDRSPGRGAEALPFEGYRERVGPYELRSTETAGAVQDVVVSHEATGTELARLPPGTWPVWNWGPGHAVDFGNVLVLQSRGWLTALPLPGPSVVGGVRTQ